MKQNQLLPGDIEVQLRQVRESGMKFPAIYADPPWEYKNRGSRGAAVNHYRTMPLEDIKALGETLDDLVGENAHLHLWTTNSFLFDAKEVMDAWGFTYKCNFVWVKPQPGLGNYVRNAHELMLIGIRGRLPFNNHSQMSWLQHKRLAHSQKPELVRDFIELVSPGPYLELFGRSVPSNGKWLVLGDEVPPSVAA